MTTLNLQVGASSDDARDDTGGGGSSSYTSNTVWMNNTNAWNGYRWTNVTIPQGSTINSATLQIYHASAGRADVYMDVYCDDVDNAATFTGSYPDVSARTKTTAFTDLDAGDVGTGWYSIDVTSAVQEIINRGGWSSGNAIVIFCEPTTGIDSRVTAWDGDSSLAAKLDIDYTAPVTRRVFIVS